MDLILRVPRRLGRSVGQIYGEGPKARQRRIKRGDKRPTCLFTPTSGKSLPVAAPYNSTYSGPVPPYTTTDSLRPGCRNLHGCQPLGAPQPPTLQLPRAQNLPLAMHAFPANCKRHRPLRHGILQETCSRLETRSAPTTAAPDTPTCRSQQKPEVRSTGTCAAAPPAACSSEAAARPRRQRKVPCTNEGLRRMRVLKK